MKTQKTAVGRIAAALAVLTIGPALLADQTWKGSADNQWTNNLNWSGNAIPGATDVVIYNTNSTANLSNFLSQAFTIKGILFSNAPGPVSIDGGALTVGASGIKTTNASQDLTITAPVALSANQTWAVAAGQNLNVSGVVSGTNTIFKDDIGILYLTGTNTFTGNVTNNAGQIWIDNSSALGVGPKTNTVAANNVGVHLNGTHGDITIASNISWVASDVAGAIVSEAGSNTIAGPINVFSGGGAPYFVANGGTLVLAGPITLGTTARPMNLGGTGVGFDTGGIGSAGLSVTKQDAGTWTLTTTNAYAGATLITGGTLALGVNGQISNSPSITLSNGATLDVSAVGNFTLSPSATNQTLSGTGSILGNVGVAGATLIQPGGQFSVGTLAFSNNLSLNGATTLAYELNTATTAGGGINDFVTVAGDLDPQGATLSITALSALTDGTYTLLTYAGNKLSSFNPGIITDSRYTFTLDESVPHQINVVVSGNNANLIWSGIYGPYWDLNGTPNWNSGTLTFLNGDSVTFDNTGTPGTISLSGALRPLSLAVSSDNNYTFNESGSGVKITGPIGITKSGNGTLTLTNANNNDFSMPVMVNGGVLSISSLSSKGSPSPIGLSASILLNGGTFQFTGAKTELNTLVTIGAAGGTIDSSGPGVLFITNLISGPGGITKVGATQLIFGDALNGVSVAGNNTYGGDTHVNAGEVQIRNARGFSTGHVYVVNGADIAAGGGGVYDPIPNDIDLNGGDGSKNAGAIGVNDAGTIANYAGTINLISSSSVGTINNGLVPGAFIISGSITNVGGLKKLGTNMVTLTGLNSYSGGTLISSGTLQLGNGAAAGTLGTGAVTNNGSLLYNHSDVTTNGLNIAGTGSLTNKGSGTLVLAGSDTYTGQTTVSGGTLLVNGSLGTNNVIVASGATLGGATGTINGAVTIQNGGTLALGSSIGALTINKTLTLTNTSITVIKLSKSGATLANDLIQGPTAINFGGTLTVTASGSALAAGDTFQIFNASAYNGAFAVTNLPTLPANLGWDTSGLGAGQLKVISTSVPQPTITSVQSLGGGAVQLTFTGTSGSGYRIWTTTNLAIMPVTNWTLLTSNAFNGTPVTFTNTVPGNVSQRFYTITTP